MNKSEATKAQIMRAAIAQFTALGYRGAAVRDIAQAAGVNIGLIRYHFGSKADLYRDTLAYLSVQYNEVCLEALEEARESGDARQIIRCPREERRGSSSPGTPRAENTGKRAGAFS